MHLDAFFSLVFFVSSLVGNNCDPFRNLSSFSFCFFRFQNVKEKKEKSNYHYEKCGYSTLLPQLLKCLLVLRLRPTGKNVEKEERFSVRFSSETTPHLTYKINTLTTW